MSVLVLDEQAKAKIKTLREYADAHRVDRDSIMLTLKGVMGPVGEKLDHRVVLESGWRIVYSIEQQPGGWCHHISVSLKDVLDTLPPEKEMNKLLFEFGFKRSLRDCRMSWVEYIGKGTHPALNVLDFV